MKACNYFAIFLAVAFSVTGCGKKVNNEVQRLPVLSLDWAVEESNQILVNKSYDLPVRVYMDNTGSMQPFIFTADGKNQSSDKYLRFMRSVRDVGRRTEVEYYIVGRGSEDNTRQWIPYENSVYNGFQEPGFYFSWTENEAEGQKSGPLSMLYLSRANQTYDYRYINVVLTDLAEQNMNNTHLAKEIQNLCKNNGCDAYLFGFKFEYHGEAEVADPDRFGGILSGRVDGDRPYYMIITGPKDYVGIYVQSILQKLNSEGLKDGEDFYYISTKKDLVDTKILLEEVFFSRGATYEEIKMGIEATKKEKDEEKDEVFTSELSCNLRPISTDEVGEMFEEKLEYPIQAFIYEKVKGLSYKYGDWKLHFYIPLDKKEQVEYEVSTDIFYLEYIENGTDNDAEEKMSWINKDNSSIRVVIEDTDTEFVDTLGKVRNGYHLSISKDTQVKEKPTDTIMAIVRIYSKEQIIREIPEWLDYFDTGNSDNYFSKTYNLKGFYEILFDYDNVSTDNGKTVYTANCVTIPILITNIPK